MKKRLIVVGVILFSILAILGLYQTFALSGVITTTDNEYNFSIIDENTIEVPAKKSKTIYYKTTNTNKGKIKYGIGYTGSNIKVKYFADTIDPVTGLINYGETKFIKLKLINNSTTNTNVVLNTILGYEKGGNLIVPNGMTLVTEKIDASNIIQMSEEATSESSTFLGSSLMRSSINSITIASDNIVPTTAIGSIDVSKNKDGTVMMWWFNSSTSNMYDVFIGSESGITSAYNCYKMFSWLTNLKTIDLTYLDTSTVSDMSYMFFKTSSIETLDLTSLNTSNVTNMKAMFSGCMQLKNVDVSNFNTLKVTSMIDMFCNCQAIKTLDLSSFVTSNVTSMSGMFYQNYNLIDLDISNFNTINVTDMQQLFNGCKSLTNINLSSFNTSKVTNFYYMFNECNSLTEINLSNFDTSSVTNMVGMFRKCTSLKKINLSSFITNKVTNTYYMFLNCTSVTEIDIRKADFSNVTNYNLMFSEIPKTTKIYVKDNNVKTWISEKFTNLTGITIV
ncbi:MAG: BspA family leucine-rich repeat surface protein [Bacilli bacterium]